MTASGSDAEPALPAERRRAVIRQGISVGVATGAYGLSCGALLVAAGFSVIQTQVLSLLLFTGGSQFAIAGLVAAGGSATAAVATSTMLGVRNGLYGLETSRMLNVRGWRRLAAAHLTLDESTAVGMAQPEPAARRLGFWTAGVSVFILWNLMTLLGALLGNALGDPTAWGLDAAAAAAFIALLWPRLRSRDAQATGVVAGLVALMLSPVSRPGVPVLVAGGAAIIVGVAGARANRDAR